MSRLLAVAAMMLGLCAGLASCGSISCPKGQSLQIVSMYWVPPITFPGHYVTYEISTGKTEESEEEYVPGYTIYGHFNYIYGCKADT